MIFMRLDYNFLHLEINANQVGCMEDAKGSPVEPQKQGKNGMNGKDRQKGEKIEFFFQMNLRGKERKAGINCL